MKEKIKKFFVLFCLNQYHLTKTKTKKYLDASENINKNISTISTITSIYIKCVGNYIILNNLFFFFI